MNNNAIMLTIPLAKIMVAPGKKRLTYQNVGLENERSPSTISILKEKVIKTSLYIIGARTETRGENSNYKIYQLNSIEILIGYL